MMVYVVCGGVSMWCEYGGEWWCVVVSVWWCA